MRTSSFLAFICDHRLWISELLIWLFFVINVGNHYYTLAVELTAADLSVSVTVRRPNYIYFYKHVSPPKKPLLPGGSALFILTKPGMQTRLRSTGGRRSDIPA